MFSKKTHNVINLISGISVFGIAVSTMAMVIVLSGFNGIEDFVENRYSRLDSDIKITKKLGKKTTKESLKKEELLALEEVANASYFIEEIAILKSTKDNWVLAEMKGIEPSFLDMAGLKKYLYDGELTLEIDTFPQTIMGVGLAGQLRTYISTVRPQTIKVLGVQGSEKLSKSKESALQEQKIPLAGVFKSKNPKYDDKFFFTTLNFASGILGYDGDVTGIELQLEESVDSEKIKGKLTDILGDGFEIQNRFDQNELLFSTHRTEKWMTFLILCFIFLLATFNMIASLTMLVLDKKRDIATLHALGANYTTIRQIFITEGLLINFLGASIGIGLGLIFTYGQLQFGWVGMGEQAELESFPVKIVWLDLLWIFGTVLFVGIITTYIPVRYLLRKPVKH